MARWLIGLLALMVLSSCGSRHSDDVDVQSASAALNAFGFRLYGSVAQDTGNVILCPLSTATALGITSIGASGETRSEILKCLCLPPARPYPQLNLTALADTISSPSAAGTTPVQLASSLWFDDRSGLSPEASQMLLQLFGCRAAPSPFSKDMAEARDEINSWIGNETNQGTPGVLNAQNASDASLVVASVVHFDTPWHQAFPPEDTRSETFRTQGGDSLRVKMMRQYATAGYWESDVLQFLDLPYRSEDFSFLCILPRESSDFAAVKDSVLTGGLDHWLVAAEQREVQVRLPRFQLQIPSDMIAPLRHLGVIQAFEPTQADFSAFGMGGLYVSALPQVVTLELDERGTKASAATAVVLTSIGYLDARPRVPLFHADHTFLFVLRHRPTGAILFLGQVDTPRCKNRGGETAIQQLD